MDKISLKKTTIIPERKWILNEDICSSEGVVLLQVIYIFNAILKNIQVFLCILKS